MWLPEEVVVMDGASGVGATFRDPSWIVRHAPADYGGSANVCPTLEASHALHHREG